MTRVPPTKTTDVATNPDPESVIGTSEPTGIEFGLMAASVGAGFCIVKTPGAFAVPPPGAGFRTLTLWVPALCRRVAGMVALSDVAETNVVGSATPASVRAIAAAMLVEGKTRVKAGVGAPESVLETELFFKELKDRKVFSLVETVVHPLAV